MLPVRWPYLLLWKKKQEDISIVLVAQRLVINRQESNFPCESCSTSMLNEMLDYLIIYKYFSCKDRIYRVFRKKDGRKIYSICPFANIKLLAFSYVYFGEVNINCVNEILFNIVSIHFLLKDARYINQNLYQSIFF